jgi:excisionase family DNA binding protein
MMNNTVSKYLTPREVASELEVSPATVVRWVRDGVIQAKRFGPRIIKIERNEVEQLVGLDGVKQKTK